MLSPKIRFFIIVGAVCAFFLFASFSSFQTKNLIDFPLVFLVLLIAILFFLWINNLNKKDKDQGVM